MIALVVVALIFFIVIWTMVPTTLLKWASWRETVKRTNGFNPFEPATIFNLYKPAQNFNSFEPAIILNWQQFLICKIRQKKINPFEMALQFCNNFGSLNFMPFEDFCHHSKTSTFELHFQCNSQN